MILIPSRIIYAGIIIPTVVYTLFIAQLAYSLLSSSARQHSEALTWSSSVSTERRKELILKRSDAVLAYKECLVGRGEWYHMNHFSDDLVFQDPLFSLEGKEEFESVAVSLARSVWCCHGWCHD